MVSKYHNYFVIAWSLVIGEILANLSKTWNAPLWTREGIFVTSYLFLCIAYWRFDA